MFGIYVIKRGGPWTGTTHQMIGYYRQLSTGSVESGIATILRRWNAKEEA